MRYTLADPSLPHQIILLLRGQDIVVSCNCMRGVEDAGWGVKSWQAAAIEHRKQWTVPEAFQVYEEWHRMRDGTVPPSA